MTLFQRNNVPLQFDLVGVDEKILKELKRIIIDHGGAVCESNTKLPIKFTQYSNYSEIIPTEARIYNIDFIMECVRQCKIINPVPYKLSTEFAYDNCLMSHFLYGGCNCLRFEQEKNANCTSGPMKLNGSRCRPARTMLRQQIISDSDDEFSTPATSLPERSENLLSPPISLTPSDNLQYSSPCTLSSSDNSQNRPPNNPDVMTAVHITIEVTSPNGHSPELLNDSTPIDESQPVVHRPHVMHRPTLLSSGDEMRTEVINHEEKRPCSLEYNVEVEPKLQMLQQQKKTIISTLKRQQPRLPTTLSSSRDMDSVLLAEIKSEDLSDVPLIDRFAQFHENEDTDEDLAGYSADLNVVKKEPEKENLDTVPLIDRFDEFRGYEDMDRDLAEYSANLNFVKKEPKEGSFDHVPLIDRVAQFRENENMDEDLTANLNAVKNNPNVIKEEPNDKCRSPTLSETSTIFANHSSSYIANSRKRSSPTTDSLPESSWIAADVTWMKAHDAMHADHPITKYVHCEDGDRWLLKESQTSSPPPPKRLRSSASKSPVNSNQVRLRSSQVLNPLYKNDHVFRNPIKMKSGRRNNLEKTHHSNKMRVISEICDKSEDDNLISQAPSENKDAGKANFSCERKGKKTNASSNNIYDDDWNQPGTSRTETRQRTFTQDDILSGASSEDDDYNESESVHHTKSVERKPHTAAAIETNCESVTAKRKKKSNDKSSNKKIYRQIDRANRKTIVLDSDSDDDDEIPKSAQNKKKSTRDSSNTKRNTGHRLTEQVRTHAARNESRNNGYISDSDFDALAYGENVHVQIAKKTVMRRSPSTKSDATSDGPDIPSKKHSARNGNRNKNVDRWDSDSDASTDAESIHVQPAKKKLTRNLRPIKSEASEKNRETVTDSDKFDSDEMSDFIQNDSDNESVVQGQRKNKKFKGTKEGKRTSSENFGNEYKKQWRRQLGDGLIDRTRMVGYRMPYTDSERELMMRYLVDTDSINRAKGLKIWESMNNANILVHRSPLSLSVQFGKMLPQIERYATYFKFDPHIVAKFKKLLIRKNLRQ